MKIKNLFRTENIIKTIFIAFIALCGVAVIADALTNGANISF